MNKILLIALFLTGCMNTVKVPDQVYTHSDGVITHIVKLEFQLPSTVIDTFLDDCKKQFTTQEEIDLCVSGKEKEYTDSLIIYLQQIINGTQVPR